MEWKNSSALRVSRLSNAPSGATKEGSSSKLATLELRVTPSWTSALIMVRSSLVSKMLELKF